MDGARTAMLFCPVTCSPQVSHSEGLVGEPYKQSLCVDRKCLPLEQIGIDHGS